ncbi:MAG: hypothetical protein JWM33_1187 [Caulobacteraceae bacterium]|nr:hypothetical protein [Caulobacteraceae bacterium]
MATLSVTSAFGAGFRVIGARPLAPLIWGLVSFSVTSPLQIYQIVRMPGLIQQLQANPDLARFGQVFGEMGAMILLAIPLSLLSSALVAAACARAVLRPEDNRYFYLRFGRTELWLVVILFCLIVGYLLSVGGGAVALIVIMRSFISLLGPAGGFLGFFVGIAFWQGLVWLFLRFSFSVPMTVRDSRPYLLASWGQTRNVGWRLVGLCWLLLLFALVVALGIGIVSGIVSVFVTLGSVAAAGPQHLRSFGTSPAALAVNTVVGALLGGYFAAIIFAPIIDAYRQTVGVVGVEDVF